MEKLTENEEKLILKLRECYTVGRSLYSPLKHFLRDQANLRRTRFGGGADTSQIAHYLEAVLLDNAPPPGFRQ